MSSAEITRLEKLRRIFTDSYNSKTKSINIINEVENEIVLEHVFIAFSLFTLISSAVMDFGMVTPSDLDIRLSPVQLISDINFVTMDLYEDVTFTGNVEHDIFNANRQSSITAEAIVYDTFTVAPNIGGATVIDILATIGGASSASHSTGSTQEGRQFIILKRNTKYLFRFTNQDTGTANVEAKAAWIETDLTD